MAKYRITAPDGRKFVITGGDTPPTQEQIQALIGGYKETETKSPSAPAETPGQKAWNSFKEDIADLTYAPRKALSGATLGATDWALRKLGVGYGDTEERYKQGWGNLGKYLGGDEEKWKAKAPRDLKILGFGAELGGNLLGGGKLLYDAIAKTGLKGLGLASVTGVAEGGITGGFSEDGSSLQGMSFGGLVPVGLSGLGHGIKYIAKKFTPSLMTQGMKGGLSNVVENPDAVKLMSQGLKRSDDIANDFLLQARPVARGINKETANMVDSALTSRVDIPEAIRSANEKYGKYMDEHGADQIYSMLSPKEQAERNFAKWNEGNKVVDEKGNPINLFHGSKVANIDVFNPQNTQTKSEGIGNFFVNKKDIAETYGDNVYETYLNMKNPLTVDYKGKFYYEPITVDGKIMGKDTGYSSSSVPSITDIARYARDNGYDGVIAKNIKDSADTGKFLGVPDEKRRKALRKLSDEDLYAEYRKVTPSEPNNINSFFNHFGKREGRRYMAAMIEQTEREAQNMPKLIADDYIVFNPNQIKSVNNSGAWSSSPSLSDAGWTPEPYIGSLYEGLNPFQAKSLKGAIVRGGEKLEKGAKLGSVDHFNKIKQDINSQISDLASRPGKESDVRLLEILKSSVDNKAPKELKVVDKIYEKAKRLENAFDRGTHYNPNNVEGADYISELSPLEQNAFAQGLFKRINNNSLTGKNLAETALDYENTLASVLSGDKYNDLMRGLNTQSTKFKRLAKLGNKAETKLGVPEADRLFAREQLEGKGSLIGSAIDLANTAFRGKSLKEASKLLLNPNYKGELGLVAKILSSPADLTNYLYRTNSKLGVGLNNTIFNNAVNQ